MSSTLKHIVFPCSRVILVNIMKVGKIEDRDQNWQEFSKCRFQAFEKVIQVSRGCKIPNLHTCISKMAATKKDKTITFEPKE